VSNTVYRPPADLNYFDQSAHYTLDRFTAGSFEKKHRKVRNETKPQEDKAK